MAAKKKQQNKRAPLRLLNDRAVGELQNTRQDGLGFDTYARILADAALGTDGPFTIGVFGEWGTGKTSLMRLIEKELEPEDDVVTVWFNAWQYEREELPVVPLIGTIIQSLERNKTFFQSFKDKGRQLLRSLRAVAYGFSANTEIQVPGFAKMEANFVAKDMIDREAAITPDPLIERSLYYQAFEALNQAPIPEGKKVVVIIDDLDRCFPNKGIRLLESIKLVLSQPGFIFVLGVAREVLEGYLSHRYEKEFGLKEYDGAAYLHKIVQLEFPLPSHRHRMAELAQLLLGDLDTEARESLKEAISTAARHVGANPRSLVRLVNNVLIDAQIAEQVMDSGVSIGALVVDRCLQMRWPAFHALAMETPSAVNIANKRDRWEGSLTDSETPIVSMVQADSSLAEFLESTSASDWVANRSVRESISGFMQLSGRGDTQESPLTQPHWRIYIYLSWGTEMHRATYSKLGSMIKSFLPVIPTKTGVELFYGPVNGRWHALASRGFSQSDPTSFGTICAPQDLEAAKDLGTLRYETVNALTVRPEDPDFDIELLSQSISRAILRLIGIPAT